MRAKRAVFGGMEGNYHIIVYYYALRFIISEHPHRMQRARGCGYVRLTVGAHAI